MAFAGVETLTNRAAEGMSVLRLTEEVAATRRLPSRFVFEGTDASRTLAITARGAQSSPPTPSVESPAPERNGGSSPTLLENALADEDAYAGLLELAGLLAAKAGAEAGALSREEEVVYSLTGIELQVSNGGWLQWLYNTEPRTLGRAVEDLRELGLPTVAAIAARVLQLGALADPRTLTAKDKNDIVSRLPETTLREISRLDAALYRVQHEYARAARKYVLEHRAAFEL